LKNLDLDGRDGVKKKLLLTMMTMMTMMTMVVVVVVVSYTDHLISMLQQLDPGVRSQYKIYLMVKNPKVMKMMTMTMTMMMVF
jgi:hypothetical protein